MTFANLILLQGEGVAIGTILLLFFLFFIGLVLLIIAIKTIKIVPQATVMLVERLGRFNRVAVMGDMDLDNTLSQRDQINGKLRLILDEATDKWGVKVTRVDVKNINPPDDVRITMEKQMTAERTRRALVLQAEGERQAAITRAEGEKQAAVTRSEGEKQPNILQAEGLAQARLRQAEAEAQAISQVAQAMQEHGNP